MKDFNYILTNIAKKIGNTPLQPFNLKCGKKLFAKLEWYNPYGSMKDRAAIAMLSDLYKTKPYVFESGNYEIVEYSGGNLGIALAYICFELGITLNLVLLDSTSKNILELLLKLNAKLHLVSKHKGFMGVIQYAKILARKNHNYVMLYQHRNQANLNIHYDTTGNEIIKQIQEINNKSHFAFVASIGTGSTLIGSYLRLRETFQIDLFATNPAEMIYGTKLKPYAVKKFSGSGGLGYGLKQFLVYPYENKIVKHFAIKLVDCYDKIRDVYEEYNIKIGTSAAANYIAAEEISHITGQDVITIFPDLLSEEESVFIPFTGK